jgi:plasmid maintenance system killer protein
MIQSFKDKRAQHLFEGKRVPEFHAFARQAEKRLRVLDAADTIEALMMLPSNRFKALSGKRQANTVSESTINGVYALNGVPLAQRMLK